MPAYPLEFPTVHIAEVKVRRVHAQARFPNPLTLKDQVQRRGPKRWEIDVTLQPMSRKHAHESEFAQFLEDLEAGYGTFNFNLDPWCLGLDPMPGIKVFRLASNEHGWSASVAEVGFSFTAVEVL
jgi:hypothetical protein